MDLIFCELKEVQRRRIEVFCELKKLKKHVFASYKRPENMNLVSGKLKKAKKITLIFLQKRLKKQFYLL